ncbi:MAG: hypothetical protein Alpg2KO_19350 [Alphaproteobacteria bacterium]
MDRMGQGLKGLTARYIDRKRGVSGLEAALLVGLVTAIAIVTITDVGDRTNSLFGEVNDSMVGATGGDGSNAAPDVPALSATSIETLSPAGAYVGTLSASDPDGDSVSFSLASGSDSSAFTIANGNQLLTTQQVDSGVQASFDITIIATDNGSPPASSQGNFTIAVGPGSGGSNNPPNAPAFSGSTTQDEEQSAGTTIGSVSASDPDGDGVILSLQPGGDNEYFSITNGQLRFASRLSHESPQDSNGNNQYELTLVASDTGSPPQVSTSGLTITIDNVNEPPDVSFLTVSSGNPGPNSVHKATEISQYSSAVLFSFSPGRFNLYEADPDGDQLTLSIESVSGHKGDILKSKMYIGAGQALIYAARSGDPSVWQELDWEEGLGCDSPHNFSLPTTCPEDLGVSIVDYLDACSFITVTMTLTEASTPERYSSSKDFVFEIMDRTNNDNQYSCIRPEGGWLVVESGKDY